MNSKDFRIGNLVFYHIVDPHNDPQEYDVINRIDHDDIRHFEQCDDNSEYKPICLDDEWLQRFGFAGSDCHYELGVHNSMFSGLMKLEYDSKLQAWIFSIGDYSDITRVKYVHQLQNLYFALTGKELLYNASRLNESNF